MSIRFLSPHNVAHGANAIAKCREARVSNQLRDVRRLAGDSEAYAKRVAGFQPAAEVTVVTEDVAQALAIAPGTKATLSFDVKAADGTGDKTVTAANAVYLGPAEDLGDGRSGAAVATMHFACHSSDGSTNPISIT
jgi:hypothetical protein